MREFIRENRAEIDQAIDRAVGHVPATASCYCSKSGTDHFHQPDKRNDDERRQWIENDEGLYSWARREGVSV
jgi:hypothetical protein